jgi:hypothetical protein
VLEIIALNQVCVGVFWRRVCPTAPRRDADLLALIKRLEAEYTKLRRALVELDCKVIRYSESRDILRPALRERLERRGL